MALFVAYRLENGWKVRQNCDKFRKNLFCATVCAPVLYALPISYGCIVGCYMPLLRGYRKSLYPYNPAYGGAVSDTDPIHKGMNQIHTPTQKSVSIDTSGKGVNLTDCTDLCNRLKIALVLDALKIECISITTPCPVCMIALSQNRDARRGLSAFGCAYL